MRLFWLALLILVSFPLLADGVIVKVTGDYVNLHSGAGRGYPIVKVAIKGETLTLLQRRTDWVQVAFKQQHYWLARQDLTHVETMEKQQFDINDDRFSELETRSWETAFLIGDFNGSSLYQLSVSYVVNPYIQTELAVGQANGEQADNLSAEFSVYLNPMPHWRLSPYFGIGGGVLRTTARTVLVQTPDGNNSIASSELGLRYYLSRNFIARAGYRRSVIVTERNDNEEINTWKLGFSVFF